MPKSRIRLVASEAELTLRCPFMPVWRDCAHAAPPLARRTQMKTDEKLGAALAR